jgi:hypothetical protein
LLLAAAGFALALPAGALAFEILPDPSTDEVAVEQQADYDLYLAILINGLSRD